MANSALVVQVKIAGSNGDETSDYPEREVTGKATTDSALRLNEKPKRRSMGQSDPRSDQAHIDGPSVRKSRTHLVGIETDITRFHLQSSPQ